MVTPRHVALVVSLLTTSVFGITLASPTEHRLKLLFLGDNGHHEPRARFQQLLTVMKASGIDLDYSDRASDLRVETLHQYDGLIVYANIDSITPGQAKALLDFVASGKGFIPLHCASYCFRNSPEVVALIGAQFKSHGTGTFRTVQANVEHPILKGFQSFESWDETYVHAKHNQKGRTVLEYRVDGDKKEPWTWVRTHGKGRVFYTAWGHDQRTWSHPGFQNLVERGIRWACGAEVSAVPDYADVPTMTAKRTDVTPFEYEPAKVPFYPPSKDWGITGEPISRMQKPLSPKESMKHYVHPTDIELRIFASEPLIQGKPICMNWDECGRCWIAESVDYPNNKLPDGQGHDRIVILEDSDGDGVADKRTVFADGLSIPTSLIFANGGIIVLAAPNTIFLRDSTGGDRANERRILFSGWGTQDTHAGPSNLQYGLDGWIYGICGYSGFRGIVGGESFRFGQGFFRFKADGSKLEFVASTNNNSWGVGFSEEGILFGSTANGNPSVVCPIPNRYYERVKGWSAGVLPSISGNAEMHPITENVRQVDYHGHFTAAAGHALYTARLYPKEYWNKTAFVCEPTGHLVATFQLTPNGGSFTSRNAWNLLASDDEWAAPIMAEVGPDSCVWVIDWYNYIVQHNPTPAGFQTGRGAAYETPLRDKKHGRIYRLVPKGKSLPEPVNLTNAPPEKLVATLKNDNFFWRRHAQRLLVERGKSDVLGSLAMLVSDRKVDPAGLNTGAIHALWTIKLLWERLRHHPNFPVKEEEALHVAWTVGLMHPSPAVRRAAILVAPDTDAAMTAVLQQLPGETDPQVCLAALLFCARSSSLPRQRVFSSSMLSPAKNPVDGDFLLPLLHNPRFLEDRVLRDALTMAAANAGDGFLASVASSSQVLPPGAEPVVSVVAGHYARGGEYRHLRALLEKLAGCKNPPVAGLIVRSLAQNWPTRQPFQGDLGPGFGTAIMTLLKRVPAEDRGSLIKLGLIWDPETVREHAASLKSRLIERLVDLKLNDAVRVRAARDMLALLPEDPDVVVQVLAVITPRASTTFGTDLLQALAETKASNLGSLVLPRLKEFSPTIRAEAIKLLMSRPGTTRLLLQGIEQGQAVLTDLSLEQRQNLTNHPDAAIAAKAKELLAKGGGLPNPDRQNVIDAWMPLLKKTGDAAKGKLVFTQHCAKCHMHSGEGKNIGPDLTGMAVHPKDELIIHILDPNRSVEGNFRTYTVVMQDGKVHTGMIASESKTSVELVDSEGKTTPLQRDDIEQLVVTNKSLMPEGFEKQVTAVEFTNLIEFLTQKGKYLPIPMDRVATITTVKGMFFADEGTIERLVFPDWKPKVFQGVPFLLIDPQGGRTSNAVMLNGPNGEKAPRMPKSVKLTCSAPVKMLHFLGGVSGWGYPTTNRRSISVTIRLRYADGSTEDHELRNGVQFADYIRRVDVPGSQFAFDLNGRQVRYLTVSPKKRDPLAEIELIKGSDPTAPVFLAITAELP